MVGHDPRSPAPFCITRYQPLRVSIEVHSVHLNFYQSLPETQVQGQFLPSLVARALTILCVFQFTSRATTLTSLVLESLRLSVSFSLQPLRKITIARTHLILMLRLSRPSLLTILSSVRFTPHPSGINWVLLGAYRAPHFEGGGTSGLAVASRFVLML